MLADGGSIHTRRILNWHLDRDCDVTFVDATDPKPKDTRRYRFVRYPGLRGKRFVKKVAGARLTGQLDHHAVLFGLKRIFRDFRPDVVHLYQIDSRAYDCYRAELKPLVLSSWGTDINQHFQDSADAEYRGRTAEALAKADMVIGDATDILDKCVKLAGRSVPTELLPLGIDTKLFRPGYENEAREWRRGLDIPADAIVLLSIRALTPLYGHHDILEAFQQATPSFQKMAFLVFKEYNDRSAPDYRGKLQRRSEELGISARVRWSKSAPFEQLPALYAAADAIVNYPSIDGFPVTFLEAAACKCPVITNRLPSYEGTLAEKYFRLVEAANTNALAEAIAEAVNGIETAPSASLDEARDLVKNEFSEAASAERLMAIYNDVKTGFTS
jgi:glycosyltransferase involved in cell wall biosynthesis